MGTGMILWALHSWILAIAFAAEAGEKSGGGIKGWAIGIGLSLALPFLFKWISSKGVTAVVNWQFKKILRVLHTDSGDPAWERFETDQVLAFARLAQAKFPKQGFGPERRALVIQMLTSRVPLLKGREAQLDDIIRKLVQQEREMLKAIGSEALARQELLEKEKKKLPPPV